MAGTFKSARSWEAGLFSTKVSFPSSHHPSLFTSKCLSIAFLQSKYSSSGYPVINLCVSGCLAARGYLEDRLGQNKAHRLGGTLGSLNTWGTSNWGEQHFSEWWGGFCFGWQGERTSEVVPTTSPNLVQLPLDHICNRKIMPPSYIILSLPLATLKKGVGEMHFNNIVYLTQYMQPWN